LGPPLKLQIKICCIQSVAEGRLALKLGATAIGLVSGMPSGPGPIPEDLITKIVAALPPRANTFLLTSLRDPTAIIDQHRQCKTKTIQLCDRIAVSAYPLLRQALNGISLVQVVHVAGEPSLEEAVRAARHVDMLLLDSGRPDARRKELGGTGRTHDWSVSARIAREVEIPVLLAGGLTETNVALAYRTVRPAGVDVCSGIRIDGRLDENKARAFIGAVNAEAGLA